MARKLDEPQGRGDFFKSLGILVAGFVAERIEDAVTGVGPKLLRPPGALDELAFLTACTRCDKCLHACPHDAILKAPPGAGLSVGTPYIQPQNMPCFLCTDLPCVPACPEGALLWPRLQFGDQVQEGPRAVRMGTARIKESRCLTFPSEDREAEDCRVCVDRCPFPGEAILMEEPQPGERPHPKVDVDHCTGCGLCAYACPGSAIEVDPRR
jgi:MauM/NapG family ferredoxin protein